MSKADKELAFGIGQTFQIIEEIVTALLTRIDELEAERDELEDEVERLRIDLEWSDYEPD